MLILKVTLIQPPERQRSPMHRVFAGSVCLMSEGGQCVVGGVETSCNDKSAPRNGGRSGQFDHQGVDTCVPVAFERWWPARGMVHGGGNAPSESFILLVVLFIAVRPDHHAGLFTQVAFPFSIPNPSLHHARHAELAVKINNHSHGALQLISSQPSTHEAIDPPSVHPVDVQTRPVHLLECQRMARNTIGRI